MFRFALIVLNSQPIADGIAKTATDEAVAEAAKETAVSSKSAGAAQEVTGSTQETSTSREPKKTDTLRSTRGNGEPPKRRCTIL
ncbi:hypothetical protein ANCCAN_13179 [Ancylostoma caninum]|uniref:Uncharacterized protein n=1 Tax=Ancylostoma caninum TaxID=29170 RepID=A0A368G945_ANCCA|nr:hypothetical protein ANCCAN_13179 [Ancylostoma caninum]